MSMWESPICRVTTGLLNTVNDTVIGGGGTGASGSSKFSGQLGRTIWFSPDRIGNMFSTTVGTLYGGRYRYVRMRDGDDDSPAVAVGQILFWDTTLTSWQTLYQVTRSESLSSVSNALMIAGIYLGGFTGGNYGWIQDLGMVPIRNRAVLTVAGAIGSPVYAAATGNTGSDQGTLDTLTTDSTALANARYLGNATTAPTGNYALTPVLLNFKNILG